MRGFLFILVLSLLAFSLGGCQPVVQGQGQTIEIPASTTVFASASPTEESLPSPSPALVTPSLTPQPPCDPLKDDCIEAGHFYLRRPIVLPGTITIDIGYPYGSTAGGARDPHHGVEFYNASGTPALAAAEGQVVVAGEDSRQLYGPILGFYGNLVVVEHHFSDINQPVFTLYGHLSKVDVQVGQSVQSGEKLGEVGASGYATGSHLHFEVRLGSDDYAASRNPILWLEPLAADDGAPFGVIAGKLIDEHGNPIHTTELSLQYYPDPDKPFATAYQIETYAPEKTPVNGDDLWGENFAQGSLPAGGYRLSLVWGGKVYERWCPVEPGKVTRVVFQVGNSP